MAISVLHTSSDVFKAFEKSHNHPIIFFKHSTTCPFSARAQEVIADIKHEDVDIYVLVVQYMRELSKQVAELTSVEHQSPQAIIVRNGKAVWDGHRDGISREVLLANATSK